MIHSHDSRGFSTTVGDPMATPTDGLLTYQQLFSEAIRRACNTGQNSQPDCESVRVRDPFGNDWQFNLPAGVAGWVIAIAALLFIALCWCFRWQLAQRYATPVRNPGLGGSLAAVGDGEAVAPLAEPAPERREGGRVAAIAATAVRAITATRTTAAATQETRTTTTLNRVASATRAARAAEQRKTL